MTGLLSARRVCFWPSKLPATPEYMDNLKFDVIFLKLVQRGSTIDGEMLPKVSEIIANSV